MAAAPNYDEMAEDEPAEDTEDVEASADPADDDEFMMAAEEAGFTGDKAKALWRAIARCSELAGGALPPLDEEADLEDL